MKGPKNWLSLPVSICLQALGRLFGLIGTLWYRELLKRNTVRPMEAIIREPRAELQRKMLRQWTRTKSRESSYIQLAVCVSGRSRNTACLTWCYLGRFSLHDSGFMLAMAWYAEWPLVRRCVLLCMPAPRLCRHRHWFSANARTSRRKAT